MKNKVKCNIKLVKQRFKNLLRRMNNIFWGILGISIIAIIVCSCVIALYIIVSKLLLPDEIYNNAVRIVFSKFISIMSKVSVPCGIVLALELIKRKYQKYRK